MATTRLLLLALRPTHPKQQHGRCKALYGMSKPQEDQPIQQCLPIIMRMVHRNNTALEVLVLTVRDDLCHSLTQSPFHIVLILVQVQWAWLVRSKCSVYTIFSLSFHRFHLFSFHCTGATFYEQMLFADSGCLLRKKALIPITS